MKKYRLRLFLSLALVLAGLAYALTTHLAWYGDSYSEQQRKAWNGVLQPYAPGELNGSQITFIVPLATGAEKTSIMTYYAQKNDEIIDRLTSVLSHRNEMTPIWSVKLPETILPGQLPLEGLTEYELLKKGEQGDAEALMELITRIPEYLTDHTVRANIQSWLEKAAQLNRPGTEFLLTAYKAKYQLSAKTDYSVSPVTPYYISSLKGFEDFRELLRKGDYTLFRVISALEPKVQTGELADDILPALQKKAAGGNRTDLRHLGEFYWRQMSTTRASLLFKIERELDIHRAPFPPRSFRDISPYIASLFQQKTSITWENCIEGEKLLKQSADAGDLPARHLWLIYAFSAKRKFSPSEWQDIFDYAQSLMEAGYAPFMDALHNYNCGKAFLPDSFDGYFYDCWSLNILTHYYKTDSVNTLFRKTKEHLYNRGCYTMIFNNTYEIVTDGKIKQEKRTDICLKLAEINPSRLYEFYCDNRFTNDRAIQEKIVTAMQELSKLDDPTSQFYLAHLYEFGLGVKKDPGRASALLEKSMSMEKTSLRPVFLISPSCLKGTEWPRIRYILLNLLEDFPEKNIPQACQMLQEAQTAIAEKKARNSHLYAPYLDFCVALTEELGLNGTPQNFDKALSKYQKGTTPYHLYRLAWLYSQGQGVPRDETLAREYLKKAKEQAEQKSEEGAARANKELSFK